LWSQLASEPVPS